MSHGDHVLQEEKVWFDNLENGILILPLYNLKNWSYYLIFLICYMDVYFWSYYLTQKMIEKPKKDNK